MIAGVASGRAAGASMGASQMAMRPGSTQNDPSAYSVNALLRRDQPSATVIDGDIRAPDKAWRARIVSTRTGLSKADVEKRVDDVIAQEKAAELKVRQAADATRKAGSYISMFTALSMLGGAFIACAAAALGSQQPDEHRAVRAACARTAEFRRLLMAISPSFQPYTLPALTILGRACGLRMEPNR